MVDEIATNRVVSSRIDRSFDFGTDAIRARHQNGFPEAGRDPKHSAESTKVTYDAAREGGFYELLDAILGGVGGIDVHPGASIAKRIVAHAGSASSNATNRRMSRIR